MEEKADQLGRLRSMAAGAPTWDLSDNDQAAIQMVLEERERLREALQEIADTADAFYTEGEEGVNHLPAALLP